MIWPVVTSVTKRCQVDWAYRGLPITAVMALGRGSLAAVRPHLIRRIARAEPPARMARRRVRRDAAVRVAIFTRILLRSRGTLFRTPTGEMMKRVAVRKTGPNS